MDTTVSRMIRLISALLVSGFVVCGILSAQSKDWGDTHGFMWGGLAAATFFTLIWATMSYNMADLLKTRTRSEFTKQSIIGLSVAFLTLVSTIGFVAGGIAAASSQAWSTAHYLLWGGNAAGVVLTIIWCLFEYYFVEKAK